MVKRKKSEEERALGVGEGEGRKKEVKSELWGDVKENEMLSGVRRKVEGRGEMRVRCRFKGKRG